MDTNPTSPPISVLVTDDVAANRRYLQAMLVKHGLQVDTAENGTEALQLWEEKQHKLVLMDVRMPDMDGAEVTRRLRLLPGADETYIVGITADLNDTLLDALVQAGMDSCIIKPTNSEELYRAIKPWIGAATQESSREYHAQVLHDDPELIRGLMRELPKDVAALAAACRSNDQSKARDLTHQIAGVAALYHLYGLQAAMKDLKAHLDIGVIQDSLLLPVSQALAKDLVRIQTSS